MTGEISKLERAVLRDRVSRFGLHEFARQFWDLADPGGIFQDSWYIGAIAEHLQAVSFREILRLVINIPPRTGKSTLCSVLWPAWHWTFEPEHRWCFVAYSPNLADRDANKFLAVTQSQRYAATWPVRIPRRKKTRDFQNNRGGGRQSLSMKGDALGRGSHTQVVDDPTKTGIDTEAATSKDHEKAWNLWNGVFSTRRDGPPELFARVVIMQRLAEKDLAGQCLEQGYEHLCLPMSYVPRCSWDMGSTITRLAPVDPRTEPGEILAERFAATLDADICDLGPIRAAAQLQQNPTPATGGVIEAAWFKEYDALPQHEPRDVTFLQSWDFGFKGTEIEHSRVHGLLGALIGEDVYLLDECGPKHWNYPQSRREFFNAQKGDWTKAAIKLVENKANGTAILDDLADDVHGMKAVEPRGDKGERLARHSNMIEAGRVHVPKGWAEWVHEIVAFPRGAYDDRVDTLTQLLDQAAATWMREQRAMRNPALHDRLRRRGF